MSEEVKGSRDETRTITLEVDPDDYRSINEAIALRQTFLKPKGHRNPLPPGAGNLPGRYIGEICRGWLEFMRMKPPAVEDGDEDTLD